MIKRVIAALSLNLIPALALAQAYGEGAYNTCSYQKSCGSNSTTIGPFTLPVTGPQLTAIIGALLIAGAVTLVLWYRARKRKQASNG
jgi:hypothetical protein